jgi:hypothetical protein
MADEVVDRVVEEWRFSNHIATFRGMLAFCVLSVCLFASV